MPGTPILGVSIDFANGPAFGNPLLLDDPSTPLGTGILADAPADVVDVSDIALRVSIRRGRNRVLNSFEAGQATVVLEDENGDYNPQNSSSPYFGKLLPLRKIRIYADYDDGSGLDRYYLFSGYITSFDNTFRLGNDEVSTVTFQCVDAFRLLQNVQITTVAGSSAGQTTGARIENLLDLASFPVSQRVIDVGDTLVQADPATSRSLLAACQNIEQSSVASSLMMKAPRSFYRGQQFQKRLTKRLCCSMTMALTSHTKALTLPTMTHRFSTTSVSRA